MAIRRLAALLVLIGACAGTSGTMKVRRTTTRATGINLSQGSDKMWVNVRTVGDDTVVDFHGREFVFRKLKGYKGKISLDGCDLDIGEAEVEIEEDYVRVEQAGIVATLELTDSIPDSKRVVYAEGSFTLE